MGMIHPFDLGDFFLVYRMQKLGVWLDPYLSTLGSELPVLAALSAPFRWRGGDLMTYVSRSGRSGGGIIQMQLRSNRPEAHILFVAPALGDDERAADLWRRLLAHCVQRAGGEQVQRLFTHVPEEAQDMLSQFVQTGFVPYTREEMYCLEKPRELPNTLGSYRIRPLTPEDGWALQRLYTAITPRLVRQAEGTDGGWPDAQQPARLSATRWERFVLVRDGEVAGLILVLPGRSGHCLKLWGDFLEDGEVLALLRRGLSSLAAHASRSVYCLVREYQSGVRLVLDDQGFRPMTAWSCLVKHTVVRAREPARRGWKALEPRAEPSVPGAMPTAVHDPSSR